MLGRQRWLRVYLATGWPPKAAVRCATRGSAECRQGVCGFGRCRVGRVGHRSCARTVVPFSWCNCAGVTGHVAGLRWQAGGAIDAVDADAPKRRQRVGGGVPRDTPRGASFHAACGALACAFGSFASAPKCERG